MGGKTSAPGSATRRTAIVAVPLIIVFFLLMMGYGTLAHGGWRTETVGSSYYWRANHDMVLDSRGNARIACLGVFGSSDFSYAERNGHGWSITQLATGIRTDRYMSASIGVDSKDRTYICTGKYDMPWDIEEVYDPHLTIATDAGGSWNVTDMPVEYSPNSYKVAFDSKDVPYILWTGDLIKTPNGSTERGYVELLMLTSDGWNKTTVFGPLPYWESVYLLSFAIDKNDKMHAVFVDTPNDTPGMWDIFQLKHSTRVNGEWVNETILDGNRTLVQVSSASIDRNGRVHLALFEWSSENSFYWLTYMTDVSGVWEKARVSYAGDGYPSASIATDSNGAAHILYYARGIPNQTFAVRYATDEAGQWNQRIMDDRAPPSSTTVRVVASSSNKVALSYFLYDNPVSALTYYTKIGIGEAAAGSVGLAGIGSIIFAVPVGLGSFIYIRSKNKPQTEVETQEHSEIDY